MKKRQNQIGNAEVTKNEAKKFKEALEKLSLKYKNRNEYGSQAQLRLFV